MEARIERSVTGAVWQGNKIVPEIANMRQKADEILRHLNSAESEAAQIRGSLFGEGEQDAKKADSASQPLDGLLHSISQRLASLVGELSTINARI